MSSPARCIQAVRAVIPAQGGNLSGVKRDEAGMKTTIWMTVALFAASAPINKDRKGVAIKGYDPVAYFTQNRPVLGAAQFSYHWMDATWWFASVEDRDLFAADPDRYAPQYGGYCAYGVSQGRIVSIVPEAWKIVDGKLYLNYSLSVQKTWLAAIQRYIEEANRNWPTLRQRFP
jgi:hypothetical protein